MLSSGTAGKRGPSWMVALHSLQASASVYMEHYSLQSLARISWALTALCSLLETHSSQTAGQLRRGSGIYECLVVDRELHRVPGTLQFVKHVPSSQLKAISKSGSRAHGVTGRSGVHGARQRSQPLWLVGQATLAKDSLFQTSPQSAQRSRAPGHTAV